MRYTFKNSGVLNLGEPVNVIGYEEYSKRYHDAIPKALVKLGQLEDLEEELGIDLAIKLKVEAYYMEKMRKAFVWCCGKKMKICRFWPTAITVLMPGTKRSFLILPYKTYGIDWAITKEELL